MIKVKDGYAKLIGTTYLGSASRVLLSNGGDFEIHTGRNSEANKLVRTDANGYILAGWINTTSGNFKDTPDRIYASNDGYIRYMTPANFFPLLTNTDKQLDITIGGLNRKLTVSYATEANLLNGALVHMCSLYALNTYKAYKITTNWHKSSNAMPTINIRGYAYGSTRTIDCDIVIYHHNNVACNYSLTNKGSYPIRVWQAIENDILVFYIDPGEYFGMFNVFVYGGINTDKFTGWTMSVVDSVSGTEISQKAIASSITGNAATATNAQSATKSSCVGDGHLILYPQYNNEINFGGTNTATTIYFGYRVTDSRPIPTSFIFGGGDGIATLTGSGFIKKGSNNNYLLLGGGGHKLISDFASASSLGNYLPLTGGTVYGSGNTPLYIKCTTTNAWCGIGFLKSDGTAHGYIGALNDNPIYCNAAHNAIYAIWHAGNDGSGSGLDADTLDGHHASKFVTVDTTQTITGLKQFCTNTNSVPLIISRTGAASTECVKIGVNDSEAIFEYINDEKVNTFSFKMINTDTEGSDGSGANTSYVTFRGDSSGSTVTANKFVKSGGNSKQFLKADGSVDSTEYLPLTGGTLTGPLTLQSERYNGNYALDMRNSDIVNVNAIFTRDLAEAANEGLQFSRGDNTYDSIWCKQGVFYFSPNGNADRKGTYNTNYAVLHSGNYNSYLPVKLINDPGKATLINSYGLNANYGSSSYGHPTEEYLKAFSKYLLAKAAGYTCIGYINPNSRGAYICDIYNHGTNSTTNLPEHITGHYFPHGGDHNYFGTSYGTWYFYTALHNGNYTTYADSKYVNTTGDTMTGALTLSYATSNNMTYASTNPLIVFSENGGQPVKLLYTDYDTYRAPAGLKVIGSESGAWFEVDGHTYAAGFVKTNSSDSYVLLGGGGHKALSALLSDYDSRYVNVAGDTMTGLLTVTSGGTRRGIKVGGTYINAIDNNLVLQNLSSIRFGGDAWDYDVWAGLKYRHDIKTVYLGLADKTVFTANNEQSGGKLYLPGISNIYTGNGTNLVWHAGNDGANSGLDADMLDSYHRSNLYASSADWFNAVGLTQSITVAGDSAYWYPVVITCSSDKQRPTFISVWKDLGSVTPSIEGNHSSGTSSLWLLYEMRSTHWDGNGGYVKTWYKHLGYGTLVAHARPNTGATGLLIVWLRGGTCLYYISCTNKFSVGIYYSSTNISGSNTYPDNVDKMSLVDNGGIYVSSVVLGYGNISGTAAKADSVTVTSSDYDYSYRMVWHSGNFLHSTAGIYCNPSSDSMYASFMELSRTTNHGLKVGSIRGTAVGSRTGEYIHMYERVHIGSPNGWGSKDAPTQGLSTYGGAWLATNEGSVGIGTESPSYKLHVTGDSYTSGWSRAGSGFYVLDKGVHFSSNGSYNYGEIACTSGNEFMWGSSAKDLYFNYRSASRGTTVTNFVWNAGSSTTYASHTLGALTSKGDLSLSGLTSTCNKANGSGYMDSALQIREYNFGGAQTDSWGIAPRLSWHWSGRVQTQIGLGSDGNLYLSKDGFSTKYKLVYETGTWGINITGSATSASKVYVNQHTGNDIEYPLVWSNSASTTTSLDNQLYKSYAKLLYNPKYNRITASVFKGNLQGSLNSIFSFGGGANNGKYYYVGSITLTNAWLGYHAIWSFTGHERAWSGLLYVGFRVGSTTTSFSGVLLEWLSLTDPTLANSIKMTYEDSGSSRIVRLYILLQSYISTSTAVITNPDGALTLSGTVVDSYSGTLCISSVGPISTSVSADRSITMVPQNGNEINFGGSHDSTTVYIGYKKIDTKPIPTAFVFGGNNGTATLKSSGFIKKDGTASQLLRADGNVATFNWSGKDGQPTWLWGGNSQHTYYVYNPSNFSVKSATTATLLAGGSIATWGTLTATNGYTNVCTWDTGGTTGAFSLAGKGGLMSLQIDGFFYQNEGKYLVLDTNNYSTYLDLRYYTETEVNTKLAGYLPLSGGTMKNSAVITLPASASIVHTTATSSNAVASLIFYKGNSKDTNYSYSAQIGWHNTGDTDGAIYLVPNPQDSAPWGGSVGLYIGKTLFKWNNSVIIHAGNYATYTVKKDGTGASGTWGISISGTANKATNDVDGKAFKTTYLRKVTVANNTTNDFNTFESMTLTGRGDPTTGAYLSNAPWTGSGPAGGYGVLTYLWTSYGVQVAFGYNSNRVYIRPRYYSSGNVWATSWDSFALSSDLGSYVKKSGDTMTGALTISYAASATMTYASTNPQIVFAESGSQPVKLIYTNYDSYRAPAGLKVIGSESGAWFEVHGNCYAAHFYENSDIKLKTNIEAITSSSNIPQLKSFDWKSDGSHSYGLIALELEEMGYSELVDSSGEHKTVKYSAALSLIVGKLQVKIKELEKEIENLKNKN